MTPEELAAKWKADCEIDLLNLTAEELRSPKLHAEWLGMRHEAKITLRNMESKHEALEGLAYFFYKNPTKERQIEYGFGKNVNQKIVLETKADLDKAVESDPIVTKSKALLEYQKDIIDFMTEVLWEIKARKEHIRNIINLKRFENGD